MVEAGDYISGIEKILPARELVFPHGVAFGQYKKLFPKAAVAHPAKMNTYLCQYLIQKYTKPGETVLDPFGGIGTTAGVGALEGRNVVSVELEKKFVDLQQILAGNIALTFGAGHITVLQGDSRNLSQILAPVDSSITSPPYTESLKTDPQSHREFWEKLANDPTSNRAGRKQHPSSGDEYSKDPKNIGNLKHGDISAAVMSPPFADSQVTSWDNTEMTKFFQKQLDSTGFVEWNGVKYNEKEWRALNGGRIDGRVAKGMSKGQVGYSASIMSPPYERMIHDHKDEVVRMEKRMRELGYSEDKIREVIRKQTPASVSNNQGYDSAVMSPPYKTATEGGGLNKNPPESFRGVLKNHNFKLSDDPRNIDNAIWDENEATRRRGGLTREQFEAWALSKFPKLLDPPPGAIRADSVLISKASLTRGVAIAPNAAVMSPPYSGAKPFHDLEFMQSISKDLGDKIRSGKNQGHYGSPEARNRSLEKMKQGEIDLKNPKQIGNLRKETYLEAVHKVYSETYKVLRPGGIACIVVKAFVREKQVIDLPLQTWLLLESCGFQLHDVLKMRLNALSFWRQMQYKRNPYQQKLWHEYIVVVRKP